MRKYMYKTKNENSAITLIALVITIIVLLILAGLTLTFVLGENGLFGKARQAKIETDKAQAIEDIKLKILEVQADAAQEGRTATLEDLYDKLSEVNQEYVVTQKNSPSATLATGSISEWNNSITALNIKNTKYDYVVEVGSSLQIENDVQTASNSGSSSNENSNGNLSNISYSLNEQDTGNTWIDGKKIYQKTIVLGDQQTSNTDVTTALNIENLDKAWVIQSYAYYMSGGTTPIYCSLPTTGDEHASVYVAGSDIIFKSGGSLWTFSGITATIQYTKK